MYEIAVTNDFFFASRKQYILQQGKKIHIQ